MAIPSIEDFHQCSARWIGKHRGISYELSWHSKSDYRPQGSWCYYLILTSEQFHADDWARLRLERQDKQYPPEIGSWHRHYDYYSFPDLDPHVGWTFGEMSVYLGRDGREYELLKVGCDYAHLWDKEAGFWQGREAVERDAKHSIDLLCDMFPRRKQQCAYTGRYDEAGQFYTARNGATVHISQASKFSETEWPMWLPSDDVAEAVQ